MQCQLLGRRSSHQRCGGSKKRTWRCRGKRPRSGAWPPALNSHGHDPWVGVRSPHSTTPRLVPGVRRKTHQDQLHHPYPERPAQRSPTATWPCPPPQSKAMASPTQGNGSISYAQFRHKGRPWYEWWWWHVMNKWNESNMCTPLQLNFPIQQQWTLLPPCSPCRPPWIRAWGTQTGKKISSSIHYIYLQRTPQREPKQRKGTTSRHCNCSQTPTLCAKFVWSVRGSILPGPFHNVPPMLSISCRTTGLHTTSGPQAIQHRHTAMRLFVL